MQQALSLPKIGLAKELTNKHINRKRINSGASRRKATKSRKSCKTQLYKLKKKKFFNVAIVDGVVKIRGQRFALAVSRVNEKSCLFFSSIDFSGGDFANVILINARLVIVG